MEFFPLNKLQSMKVITLQETITHLMNYQQCALHASRAYVLEDNRRYTIFKPGARRPARAWFLEIAFVREVSMRVCVWMCVCVCVRPRGHK